MKKVSAYYAQAADCRALAVQMYGATRAAFLDMALTLDCLAVERVRRLRLASKLH